MVHRHAAEVNSAPAAAESGDERGEEELKEFDHPCGIGDRSPSPG
jgi:hypothetical protein